MPGTPGAPTTSRTVPAWEPAPGRPGGMAQPHKGQREHLGTRVPVATAQRIRAAASAEGVSLSDLLLAALERYVDELGQDQARRPSRRPGREPS